MVEGDKPLPGRRSDKLSTAEKINNLHEAYQFLMKKYAPPEERECKANESQKWSAAAAAAVQMDGCEEPSSSTDSYIDFSHLRA